MTDTHSHQTPASPPAPTRAVARRPRPGIARVPEQVTEVIRRPRPGPPSAMVRAAPNIARVAAVSAFHVANWTVGAALAATNYVARRAVEGEPATSILQDAATDLRNVAWRALGLQGLQGTVVAGRIERVVPEPAAAEAPATVSDLQRRGEELLRRSNDVHVSDDTHPAFGRILSEITPDEARILRYIYLEGPQPALDVRTNRPLGIGSVLIAAGLSMIAEHAGLRNVERIDPYLTNLSRLGLVDFSKEQVSNPNRYQVIEAQPKVMDAMKAAGRSSKLVQRSIRLTSFGVEFVRTCLPLNGRVIPQRAPSLPGRPSPK